MSDAAGDLAFMKRALALAEQAEARGEVPVGAVLVRGGEVLGEGYNQVISTSDPTAHAEVVALRDAAGKVDNYRLPRSTLYVTIEPCTMCVGAIIHARVSRVLYASSDPKGGAAGSVFHILGTDRLNHQVEVDGGLLGDEAGSRLQRFFKRRRRTSDGIGETIT